MTTGRYIASTLKDLPAPQFVENLSWSAISSAMQASLQTLADGEYYWLPSDPLVKLLDIAADAEVRVRQKINETGLATTAAWAKGADLDNRGATLYGTYRLLLDDSDPKNVVYEADEPYRERCELAFERLSNAGPEGAYEAFAREASALVRDARAYSPEPAVAQVFVLSTAESGVPDADLLLLVRDYLRNLQGTERGLPAGDRLDVLPAEIVPYVLHAVLYLYDGIGEAGVLAQAETNFAAYRVRAERIGHGATRSGIDQALHVPGVYKVDLTVMVNGVEVPLPVGDGEFQAAICLSHQFEVGGRE